MVIGMFEDCCEFAYAALDGVYGWASEAIATIVFVFIFNFFIKWLLKRLHLRFEKHKQTWKDSFVQALYLPLSYLVWFFAAVQTLDLIGSRIFNEFPFPNRHMILGVGAVLAGSWFLMRWKRLIVQHMIAKSKTRQITIDRGKIDAMGKIATVAIAFFTILLLLEVTHHNVTTLIAFGGIGGLALAFASQEIIANFFGGLMIYLTQPFSIGDLILLPDRSIEGNVEEIGWYMTRIRSPDKRPIYIPNSIFSKIVVITPSRMSHRQIKETIRIRYEDFAKLKGILPNIEMMLRQNLDLDQSLPISVRLAAFGRYSLDIDIIGFTQTTDSDEFMKIKEDVLFKIAEILKKHNAEFATQTQHITLSYHNES